MPLELRVLPGVLLGMAGLVPLLLLERPQNVLHLLLLGAVVAAEVDACSVRGGGGGGRGCVGLVYRRWGLRKGGRVMGCSSATDLAFAAARAWRPFACPPPPAS